MMARSIPFLGTLGSSLLVGLAMWLAGTALLNGEAVAAPDAAEIDRLITQLGDDAFAVRERASKRLVRIGRPALAALELASRDSPDPEVRSRAERAIQEIRGSLPFLLGELKDKDASVRKRAAEMLGRRGTAARPALEALTLLLKDANDDVREAAVAAILNIDPENRAAREVVSTRASVKGKYKTLLRRLHVPGDRQQYGEFNDYGFFQGTDYLDFNNLPPGYWVYVYPHWHIWKEQVNP